VSVFVFIEMMFLFSYVCHVLIVVLCFSMYIDLFFKYVYGVVNY
jgi:hypothetical protein